VGLKNRRPLCLLEIHTAFISGKPLETAPKGEKAGKYSLENALMLKAYAGMQTLKEDANAKMH
jgi:hypothetical protein